MPFGLEGRPLDGPQRLYRSVHTHYDWLGCHHRASSLATPRLIAVLPSVAAGGAARHEASDTRCRDLGPCQADQRETAGWLDAVISLTLVACSRFATTRASRRVSSYPRTGSDSQRARTARPSNSKASTGPMATAPKAHLYGGNSHDQPSSSPMPMVSIFIRPCPGTCRSRATWPDWISQNRVAPPPSSKSRCRAGNVTSEAVSASTARWSPDMPCRNGWVARASAVTSIMGYHRPAFRLRKAQPGPAARSRPVPEVPADRDHGPPRFRRYRKALRWTNVPAGRAGGHSPPGFALVSVGDVRGGSPARHADTAEEVKRHPPGPTRPRAPRSR